MKVRSPWAVALLPIITLGIYHLVWWYKINKELKAYGEAKGYDLGQNPTNSLLALFPGGIIIIPALITYWRGTKRVQGSREARPARSRSTAGSRCCSTSSSRPAMWAYLQVSLNHVWEAGGRAAAGPRGTAGLGRDAAAAAGGPAGHLDDPARGQRIEAPRRGAALRQS